MEKNKCPECGKLKDASYTLCWECSQKKREESRPVSKLPMAKEDRESIERQQAMICTSRILEGHDCSEETIVRTYNICLHLIRG